MTQTALETNAANPYAILVTLTWGDANTARYCRWDSDLTVDSDTFTSVPTLAVKMNKPQHGGVDDAPMELKIHASHSPFDKLITLYPHAKVDVLIEEVVPGDDTTRQTIFYGRIAKVSARPSSLSGHLATCEVVGIKAKMKAILGLQCLTTCAWVLGQSPCGYDLSANTLAGTVNTISTTVPTRLTIDFTGSPDMSNVRWNRGYLQYDGLRISIRKCHDDGSNPNPTVTFDLKQPPPPEWATQDISVVPGCDKKITTCRIHDQESQFMGAGYSMPGYNPVFASN